MITDEPLIRYIHEHVIPPPDYYAELEKQLAKKFPKVSRELIQHCVSLVAAFDTATAFGLSFGIKKFQLAQEEVQLVGEIVGRTGRRPNPALCEALRKWPKITNLKELQSFLGTINYARPHCGAQFSRIFSPLRVLLTPKGVFPMNETQIKAIEELKQLVVTHS